MSCSTTRMVRFRAMRRTSSTVAWVSVTLMPAVASCRHRSWGAVASAMAISRLRCSPWWRLAARWGSRRARMRRRGAVRRTWRRAVRPLKRMVSPSVRRIGSRAPRSDWTGARGASAWEAVTRLRELARGRNDRLFLRDDVEDLVLHVARFEEELAHQGLRALPPKRLI